MTKVEIIKEIIKLDNEMIEYQAKLFSLSLEELWKHYTAIKKKLEYQTISEVMDND